MNPETAESLLRCHRPGTQADGRTQKALRAAQQDPALQQRLDAQLEFDAQLIEVIHAVQPPEDFRKKLSARSAAAPEKKRLRRQIINPAVLTAILGVLLLAGIVVFLVRERMEKFPGREQVEGLLGTAAKMTGGELDTVALTTSQLGDWFYMKNFDGYEVPPELAAQKVVGARVFQYGGQPIAQIAVGTAEQMRCLLYEFQASKFGVQLPATGDWTLLTRDTWVGAIRQRDDRCFLLAFRGDKPAMRAFLQALPKP